MDSPAIGFSINYQIDDRRGIVAQTHVPQDASSATMDEVLDRIFTSIDRRVTMFKLEDWHRKLANDQKQLKRLEEDYARIGEVHLAAWEASGKRGAFKLDTKQEQDKRNAESTLERYRQEIEINLQGIAECEAKLKRDGV